jgi:opacity protein-like surface antigen
MLSVSSLAGVSDIRGTLTTIAVLLLSSAANASDDNLRFEITPFGGYRFGGSFDVSESDASYEFKDSSSFGLIFNLRDQANTQWELLYSKQSTEVQLQSEENLQPLIDIDMQILQIGGTYQGDGDVFRPYLAATIGGTNIKAESGSDNFFSGSIGLGLQIRPADRLGIRLEARAYGTLTDSDTDLFCSTGPDQNICAIRVDGKLLSQFETFAGVVFRF